jgi:hypothetical protein
MSGNEHGCSVLKRLFGHNYFQVPYFQYFIKQEQTLLQFRKGLKNLVPEFFFHIIPEVDPVLKPVRNAGLSEMPKGF